MDVAVLGDRLPEVTPKPLLGQGSLSFSLPELRELERARNRKVSIS